MSRVAARLVKGVRFRGFERFRAKASGIWVEG